MIIEPLYLREVLFFSKKPCFTLTDRRHMLLVERESKCLFSNSIANDQ